MENRELIYKLNEAEAVLQEMDFLQNHRSAIQQLKQKQQNKELNISVVGQFKRGKSSFINAVLKEPILPVGIVPITSVVTKIKYGSEGATFISTMGGWNKFHQINWFIISAN